MQYCGCMGAFGCGVKVWDNMTLSSEEVRMIKPIKQLIII